MGLITFLKGSRTFKRFYDVLNVKRFREDFVKVMKTYFEGLKIFFKAMKIIANLLIFLKGSTTFPGLDDVLKVSPFPEGLRIFLKVLTTF